MVLVHIYPETPHIFCRGAGYGVEVIVRDGFVRTGLILSAAVSAISAAAMLPAAAVAEDRNQFFESNAVDNFTVPVVERQGMGFEYFADTEKQKHSLDKFDEKPLPKAPEQKQPAQQEAPKAPQQFTSGADVLNAYGDPGKDIPVLAQENAPKPFKAMMAAFEAGDERLAYGYARQWVRYMDHVQQRTSRVIQATEAAQASEKLVSSAVPGAEQLKQSMVNENAHLKANLDPRAQALLAQAEADEEAAKSVSPASEESKEAAMRKELRGKIAGRVPVDPEGRIDIYIFFAPNDPKAKEFAETANKIYQYTLYAEKANFAAFSSARLNADALKRQQEQFGVQFNLMAGDGFAKELQLKSFPAVVFVSPTTGKILRETADKPYLLYEELIKAIQGRGV